MNNNFDESFRQIVNQSRNPSVRRTTQVSSAFLTYSPRKPWAFDFERSPVHAEAL